jgi:hypothetical protein
LACEPEPLHWPIEAVPETRLIVPDGESRLDTGVIGPKLARTQSFQSPQRKECRNDALMFLSARDRPSSPPTATNSILDHQLAHTGQFIHF